MSIIVQEKFYQAVVENSSSGLLAFDEKGIIKLANTKATELLGIKQLHNISLFYLSFFKVFYCFDQSIFVYYIYDRLRKPRE